MEPNKGIYDVDVKLTMGLTPQQFSGIITYLIK